MPAVIGTQDLLSGIDDYFELKEEERDEIFLRAYARIGIDREEASKRIRNIRNLPVNQLSEICEGIEAKEIYEILDETRNPKAKIKALGDYPEPELIYDTWRVAEEKRIILAAEQLALLSKPFRGPRGDRPILITSHNIAKFLGVRDERALKKITNRINRGCGGIRELIKPYSSCNISDANAYDLKRGVQIPLDDIDEYQAEALGIIGVFGYLGTPYTLYITGRKLDIQFFFHVKQLMEEAFNLLPHESLEEYEPRSTVIHEVLVKFGSSIHPRLQYSSKGLYEFLESQGIPKSREEKYEMGVPPIIKQRVYKPYLRGVLSGCVLNIYTGQLHLTEKSKKFLEEISQMLISLEITPSMKVGRHTQAKSHYLLISTVPTREIYDLGLMIHPEQQGRFRKYLDSKKVL